MAVLGTAKVVLGMEKHWMCERCDQAKPFRGFQGAFASRGYIYVCKRLERAAGELSSVASKEAIVPRESEGNFGMLY